jgi:two-component system sensor histidine kinase ChvG
VFAILPFVIYDNLQEAELRQRALLLNSVQDQGHLVATGIAPWLPADAGKDFPGVREVLDRYESTGVNVKLLWRPVASPAASALYYVASVPSVPAEYLEQEVRLFREMRLISQVRKSCDGDRRIASSYFNPAGGREILTAITPIRKGDQCWIVVTSASEDMLGRQRFGTPYWQSPEIVLSGLMYLSALAFTLWLLLSVWLNVRRFGWLARRVRFARESGGRFSDLNRVPELDGVARALDDMVGALRGTAQRMRESAEERAHAFKTPLATIAQSVRPLRHSVGDRDVRSRRALDVIERSLERLEELLDASHRADEANAQAIDPPHEPIELTALVRQTAQGYFESLSARASSVELRVSVPETPVTVAASDDLIETVLENLLENAISFSPAHGHVDVGVAPAKNMVEIAIADEGPGIDPAVLPRIFDRYFTMRAAAGDDGDGETGDHLHRGIGLWVVRRNVEALGGSVAAENRDGGGLTVKVTIPKIEALA